MIVSLAMRSVIPGHFIVYLHCYSIYCGLKVSGLIKMYAHSKIFRHDEMKAASLSSENPHAKSHIPDVNSDANPFGTHLPSVSTTSRWSNCHGCAVADDSKRILAVQFNGDEYIMADIRYIPQSSADGRICLEFFFDGDTDALRDRAPCGFEGFFDSLRSMVIKGVQEYYKRRLSAAIGNAEEMKKIRSSPFPDTLISAVGKTVKDAFRDAGCMLSFIAVRITISEECAAAIGAIAFPEAFGVKGLNPSDDTPVPKWLVGMGFATVVVAIGTIYAWANIFLYGNSYS